MRLLTLSLASLLVAAPSLAAPRAKAKGAKTAPTTELKPAPVEAPTPAPVRTPAPVVAPSVPVVQAAPPAVELADELTPLTPAAPRAGFVLQAQGGPVIPFAVLGVGGRGELRLSYFFSAPLGVSLSAGFEQHAGRAAALFGPPAGGYDPAALDNQTVFPVQVLAHVPLLRDEQNRVDLAAGYSLLTVWSQAQALGRARNETGVGHEFALEGGYARRLGGIELQVRARYSLRRTAVGPLTATIELPWYQTAGVLVGLGLPL